MDSADRYRWVNFANFTPSSAGCQRNCTVFEILSIKLHAVTSLVVFCRSLPANFARPPSRRVAVHSHCGERVHDQSACPYVLLVCAVRTAGAGLRNAGARSVQTSSHRQSCHRRGFSYRSGGRLLEPVVGHFRSQLGARYRAWWARRSMPSRTSGSSISVSLNFR
jgi:hypothetical protein